MRLITRNLFIISFVLVLLNKEDRRKLYHPLNFRRQSTKHIIFELGNGENSKSVLYNMVTTIHVWQFKDKLIKMN